MSRSQNKGSIRNLMNMAESDKISSQIGVNPNHDSQGTFGSAHILDRKTHRGIGNKKVNYFLINGEKVPITATNREAVLEKMRNALK